MSVFIPHRFNLKSAEQELEQFADLLAGSDELKEREQVLKKFRLWPNLSVLFGTFAGMGRFNRLKHEFRVGEILRADLAITQADMRNFCLIEFEGAKEGCIFKRGRSGRTLPKWAGDFEQGFSQIVDWSWAVQNRKSDPLFRDVFRSETPRCMGVLVVGRSSELQNATDTARWDWRSEKVIVDGWRTTLQTYDQLYESFDIEIKMRKDDAELVSESS